MTDASAYLIEHKMSPSQRDALMGELFGPAPGLNLSFMRLTIGASDFSQVDYSYDDMPAGDTDPTLAHFSIASAKTDVVPAVKQALALNPKLTVMASPWSAPGRCWSTSSLTPTTSMRTSLRLRAQTRPRRSCPCLCTASRPTWLSSTRLPKSTACR